MEGAAGVWGEGSLLRATQSLYARAVFGFSEVGQTLLGWGWPLPGLVTYPVYDFHGQYFKA